MSFRRSDGHFGRGLSWMASAVLVVGTLVADQGASSAVGATQAALSEVQIPVGAQAPSQVTAQKSSKPVATLKYLAGLDSRGRLLVVLTSNALKVTVKYQLPRQVKGASKPKLVSVTKVLTVRRGTTRVLLPAQSVNSRAQAQGTKKLQASKWLPLKVATSAPSPIPTPRPSGSNGTSPSQKPGPSDDSSIPPTSVGADINGDGATDCADLAILRSDWGTANPRSDLDRDGSVGVSDWSRLMSAWSAATAQCAAPPATPTGLFAMPRSGGSELGWRRQDGVFFWRVYRSESIEGPWSEAVVGPIAENSATVTGLTDGKDYYLSVAAVGEGGESLKSEPIRVVPVDVPKLSPSLAANGHVISGSAVLGARNVGGGAVRLDVAADQGIGEVGDPVIVKPAPDMPLGMLGTVQSISSGPEGVKKVQLTPAALDVLFPGQKINFDTSLARVETGVSASGTLIAGQTGGATSLAVSADNIQCSQNGVPKSPKELWETDLPFPIAANVPAMRVIHTFQDNHLLLKLSGELNTKFALRAKSAFKCELTDAWRQENAISYVIANVAGVPVTLRFELSFEFQTSAAGEVSFAQNRDWGVSVDKRDGSDPVLRKFGSADPPVFLATRSVPASVVVAQGEITMTFGGGAGGTDSSAGLYMKVGPKLDVSVKTATPPCYEVGLAMEFDGGLRLNRWVKGWDDNAIGLSVARAVLLERCISASAQQAPAQPGALQQELGK